MRVRISRRFPVLQHNLLVTVIFVLAVCFANVTAAWVDRLRPYRKECFYVSPCVMLLGRDRAIGCGQCSKPSITQPVLELLETQELLNFLDVAETPQRVLLVPEVLFYSVSFQAKLPYSSNVAAVVVYDGFASSVDLPATPFDQHSTDLQIPNQGFNLADFKYNPLNQTEAQFQFFPFNIFRVNATVADRIRARAKKFNAAYGVKQRNIDPSYVLQSRGKMLACPSEEQLEKAGQADQLDETGLAEISDSATCLKDGTCAPVGGHSVWSSLDVLGAPKQREILAVTVPFDSIAFFHDIAQGAANEVSSLSVLMAVAEAVGNYRRSEGGRSKAMLRQPVYFAWTAQSWGYAGSSRFLEDVKYFKCNKLGDVSMFNGGCLEPYMSSLRFKDFEEANFTVLNLGGLIDPLPPVRLRNSSTDPSINPKFFLHGLRLNSESLLKSTLASSFGDMLNDGRVAVPPDASQSFAQYYPDAESLSVTNYKKIFTNKFYHSQYDNVSLIPKHRRRPLYDAAQAVAEAVVKLSFGDSEAKVTINETTIDEFIHCFTSNWTQVPCSLARDFQGKEVYEERKSFVKQGNYAGVFESLESSRSEFGSPYVKADLVATFLAYHNRYEEGRTTCRTNGDCNDFIRDMNRNAKNYTSLRVAFCARGTCVASDTFMHNAYGTAITGAEKGDSVFEVNQTKASKITNPQAPQWTESYWDSDLGLCGFALDSRWFGLAVLLGGIGLNVLSFSLVFWISHRFLSEKQLNAQDESNNEATV